MSTWHTQDEVDAVVRERVSAQLKKDIAVYSRSTGSRERVPARTRRGANDEHRSTSRLRTRWPIGISTWIRAPPDRLRAVADLNFFWERERERGGGGGGGGGFFLKKRPPRRLRAARRRRRLGRGSFLACCRSEGVNFSRTMSAADLAGLAVPRAVRRDEQAAAHRGRVAGSPVYSTMSSGARWARSGNTGGTTMAKAFWHIASVNAAGLVGIQVLRAGALCHRRVHPDPLAPAERVAVVASRARSVSNWFTSSAGLSKWMSPPTIRLSRPFSTPHMPPLAVDRQPGLVAQAGGEQLARGRHVAG